MDAKTKKLIKKRDKVKHGDVIKRPSDGATRFAIDNGNGGLVALNLHSIAVKDEWEVIGHNAIDISLTISSAEEEKDMFKIVHRQGIYKVNSL